MSGGFVSVLARVTRVREGGGIRAILMNTLLEDKVKVVGLAFLVTI